MSSWKLITPQATTNLVSNPSFEIDSTGWGTSGTNTIAASPLQSIFGINSLLCTYQNNPSLTAYSITLTAAQHTLSAWVYIPSTWDGGNIRIQPNGFVGDSEDDITEQDTDPLLVDVWQRISIVFTPVGGDLSGSIEIRTTSAPTAGLSVYVDGVQAEIGTGTTYCDGDKQGCAWNGAPYTSTSTRNQFEAAGGVVNDISDDLNFIVSAQDGTGMPPVNNLSSVLALQPGALFDGQTIRERSFSLTGDIIGNTTADFHAKKQALIKALNPNVATIGTRSQPRTLRYTGGAVDKEIAAVYDGGLEPGLPIGFTEVDYKLRLKADDPLFYQVGESSAVLDTNDSATVSAIIKKGNDGLWDVLGAPAMATSKKVYAITEDDTYIYIGGDFFNLDGIANADRIARYNKETGVWSALGTGLNDVCYTLKIAADGTLYAGGDFTTANGVATNYIASWNGTTFAPLGTGFNGGCLSISISPDGTLYAGGDFTTAGGGGANYIASWDGTSWAALGTGFNALCGILDTAKNGILYAGGNFTTAGGTTVNYISSWDGTAWAALGTGLNAVCDAISINENGIVYIGGSFTTADGVAALRVCSWNGASFSALGSGFDSTCLELISARNGILYAAGGFTLSGTIPLLSKMALWNGSVWTSLDINTTSALTVAALFVSANESLYIGTTDDGIATYSGQTAVSYIGTYPATPVIKVKRTGGTSARLVSITNATTKAELFFNYSLQDGETLTIDTRAGKQTIKSSFFGNVYSALLPNSDFGNFYLMSGNTSAAQSNIITAFVDEVGSPTVTATMQWKDAYISED